jgi:hypothetical protein
MACEECSEEIKAAVAYPQGKPTQSAHIVQFSGNELTIMSDPIKLLLELHRGNALSY